MRDLSYKEREILIKVIGNLNMDIIGRVGEDSLGTQYLSHLRNESIGIANVEPVTHFIMPVITPLLQQVFL